MDWESPYNSFTAVHDWFCIAWTAKLHNRITNQIKFTAWNSMKENIFPHSHQDLHSSIQLYSIYNHICAALYSFYNIYNHIYIVCHSFYSIFTARTGIEGSITEVLNKDLVEWAIALHGMYESALFFCFNIMYHWRTTNIWNTIILCKYDIFYTYGIGIFIYFKYAKG
jgi:hypothetical protein